MNLKSRSPLYAGSSVGRSSLAYYASVKNFQQGKAGYVADIMEQVLLLPKDMADLKSMRKHEVFLSLKRDFALVSPSTTFLFLLS